jgi:hypothetical protein
MSRKPTCWRRAARRRTTLGRLWGRYHFDRANLRKARRGRCSPSPSIPTLWVRRPGQSVESLWVVRVERRMGTCLCEQLRCGAVGQKFHLTVFYLRGCRVFDGEHGLSGDDEPVSQEGVAPSKHRTPTLRPAEEDCNPLSLPISTSSTNSPPSSGLMWAYSLRWPYIRPLHGTSAFRRPMLLWGITFRIDLSSPSRTAYDHASCSRMSLATPAASKP